MFSEFNEPIQVGAVFRGNRLKPLWFIWNGRRYKIKEVTYTWNDRNGEEKLYHFSVSDGKTLYEICFNDNNLTWHLIRVYLEG